MWWRVRQLRKAWHDAHLRLGLSNQWCPCIRDKGITRSKGIRYRLQGKGGLPTPAWRAVAEPAGNWELCKEREVLALHPGAQAASRAEPCFPEEENGISVWSKDVARMSSSGQSSTRLHVGPCGTPSGDSWTYSRY